MIVQCTRCGGRFDVKESLLLPSGRKLKCSKCQEVFYQAPPGEGGPGGLEEPGGAAGAKKAVPSGTATVPPSPQGRGRSTPVVGPSRAPAKGGPSLDKPAPGVGSRAAGGRAVDFLEEEHDDLALGETLVSRGGAPQGNKPAGAPPRQAEAASRRSSARREEPLANDRDIPLEDLASETAMSDLFDAMDLIEGDAEGADHKPRSGVRSRQESFQPSDDFDLDEVLAGMVEEPDEPFPSAARRQPESGSRGGVLDEETVMSGAIAAGDSEEWETPGHALKEINLDDETLIGKKAGLDDLEDDDEDRGAMATMVAAKGLGTGSRPLSEDEEEALGSLGFSPGLNQDEEDALGSLGLRKDARYDDGEPYFGEEEELAPAARSGSAARSAPRTQVDEEEEDEGPPPVKPKRWSLPPWMAWLMIVILLLTLGWGWVVYRTGFREWLAFKSFDMSSSFRLISVEGEWREVAYGSLLIVNATLQNTSSANKLPPATRISLMDGQNKVLANSTVIPGRVLTDKDLASNEVTLRTLITMLGDTTRITPKKIGASKKVPVQAVFINPPEGAVRFQVDLEAEGRSDGGKGVPEEKAPPAEKPAEKPAEGAKSEPMAKPVVVPPAGPVNIKPELVAPPPPPKSPGKH